MSVEVLAKLGGVDRWCIRKRCHNDLAGNEATVPQRDQLTNGHAVASDNEGLALVETAHDLSAVVAEFSLGDDLGHEVTVARVRHRYFRSARSLPHSVVVALPASVSCVRAVVRMTQQPHSLPPRICEGLSIARVAYIHIAWGTHLVDLDDDALSAARAELRTSTIKDTVNEALRRTTAERSAQISNALDVLANAILDDREDAWQVAPTGFAL